MRNLTPTVLDCAREFIPAIQETIKKQSTCGYVYVTSEKKSFYESPEGLVPFSSFPMFRKAKPPKISPENLQRLLHYRNAFGNFDEKDANTSTIPVGDSTMIAQMVPEEVHPLLITIFER